MKRSVIRCGGVAGPEPGGPSDPRPGPSLSRADSRPNNNFFEARDASGFRADDRASVNKSA
jgi:hypothetical protein